MPATTFTRKDIGEAQAPSELASRTCISLQCPLHEQQVYSRVHNSAQNHYYKHFEAREHHIRQGGLRSTRDFDANPLNSLVPRFIS